MAVLGPRLRIAVIGLFAIGGLGTWAAFVYHEKQASNTETVERDNYQPLIERWLRKQTNTPIKPPQTSKTPTEKEEKDDKSSYAIRRAQSAENLRLIAAAVRQYAADHGNLPPDNEKNPPINLGRLSPA